MKAMILGLLLAVPLLPAVAESANPFTSSGPAPSHAEVVGGGSLGNGFIAALAPLLRSMTDRLTVLTEELHRGAGAGPLLVLILISFLYGIFHALGPGHGKTLVSAFFLAREAKLRQGLALGYLIAVVHALSAMTVVSILYFIIRQIFSTHFENASRVIRIVSFGIIAVLGGVMLIRRILGRGSHCCGHGHGHAPVAGEGTEVTGKELFGIALASGLVPCPGASAIILLTLSLNMIVVSILSVSAISLGMGLTVSAIGSVTILAKRGVLGFAARRGSAVEAGHEHNHEDRASLLRRVIELAGSALLFIVGLLFFIAQF